MIGIILTSNEGEYTTARKKVLCHVIEIYFLWRHAKPQKRHNVHKRCSKVATNYFSAGSVARKASSLSFNGTLTHPLLQFKFLENFSTISLLCEKVCINICFLKLREKLTIFDGGRTAKANYRNMSVVTPRPNMSQFKPFNYPSLCN